MKKIAIPTLLLAVFFVGCFFLASDLTQDKTTGLPSFPQEENKALRMAWEKQRLADPATGEIPQGIRLLEQAFAKSLPIKASNRAGGIWENRGPYNVGGRTRALTMDINDENRLMAGGVSGGVWLSEDGGQSWERTTPLNAHPGCVSIVQDKRPGHTDSWFYLSGEVYGTSASATGAFYLGDGMFKSTDNGLTWTPITSTAGGNPNQFTTLYQSGWRLAMNPANETQTEIYMATIGTIYRSVNSGISWSAVIGGNTSAYSYFADVAVSNTGVRYATMSSDGPQGGIWRSTNGTSWTNITPANFPAEFNRMVIEINPNNENEVYILAETPGYGHYNNYIDSDDWSSLWKYEYLSGDGSGAGGTWTDLSGNMPSVGTEFDQFACQGGYDLVVRVQPGTNNVFIGGTNIYRSTDGFTSPDNTTHIGGYKPGTSLPYFELYPNHHPDIHDLLFLPSDSSVLLSASDGGLHRTDNCNAPTVVWNSLNRGYQTSQFYTAMIEHTLSGDHTLIGGLQDNGNFFTNSNDPQSTWVQTVNGDGAYGAILDNKSAYVLSIQQGRVAKCDIDANGQVTAYTRIDPIGPDKSDYLFINPLAIDPSDQDILFLPAGNKLYRQSELGNIVLNNAWDSIAQGWTVFPDSLESADGRISAIAVSQTNPAHRVYFGTSANKLYRIDDAHTGTPSWTPLTSPAAPNGNVSCIAIDPDDADNVIVAYSNYNIYSLFQSTNGGQTWAKVGGNLEASSFGTGNAPSIRWVSILPFADGSRKYFCGTSIGLYSTDTLELHSVTQAGTQWELESPDLIGSSVIDFIDVRPVDGLVVVATHGRGMFSSNYTNMVSTQGASGNTRFSLSPNPASDYIRITLEQPVTKATVSIMGLSGKQYISRNVSGSQIEIPIAQLADGTYLCSLRTAHQTQTVKFVKTKF